MAMEDNDEKQVVQYWERPLVEMVEKLLPALSPQAQFLQIGCQSGLLTQFLRDRCPRTSRLLITKSDSNSPERTPAQIDGVVQLDLPDQAGLSALHEVHFDGVVGIAAPFAYLRSLEQVFQLVSVNGFVLLGGLLRESCQELLDIFLEVLEQEDLVEEQEKLAHFVRCLPRADEVRERLAQSGFDELDIVIKTSSYAFPGAEQLMDSVLTRFLCLDVCLALIQRSKLASRRCRWNPICVEYLFSQWCGVEHRFGSGVGTADQVVILSIFQKFLTQRKFKAADLLVMNQHHFVFEKLDVFRWHPAERYPSSHARH